MKFVDIRESLRDLSVEMGEPSVSKSDAPNPEWPIKDRDGYITVFTVCHAARSSAWRSD
jgi:hypothetical protein